MFGTIDRVMGIVAKSVLTAVIDGFAAYAYSIHMPPSYGDSLPSGQEFPASSRRK